MRFRLAPNSLTLDDLERRRGTQLQCTGFPNSLNRGVISPNSGDFEADYVKVVEDRPIYFLQRKCRPKNLVLAIIYGDIGRVSPPASALK